MTIQEIQIAHERAINALNNKELKTAFDSLQNLISGSQVFMFQDKLNEITETYKQLLHYYAEGSKDPMREKIYNEICIAAYEMADNITDKLLTADSTQIYYTTKRTMELQPENIVKLTDTILSSYETNNVQFAETAINKLFKRIWSSENLENDEIENLHNILTTNQNSSKDSTILNCQIVSALIVGLQQMFNQNKMLLLFDAAENNDEEVKIRAYIGILITIYLYKPRTECYTAIANRLDNLSEKPNFRKIIYLIIKQFILSRDTEKISHKLQDEIIPEMMKLSPKFNPRSLWNDLSSGNTDDGMNPEWMGMISDSKLGKKIEEFNELQEEGADVMHSTFVHLKHFPFFNEISNWFLPFNKNQSFISNDEVLAKSVELITQTGLICNSDLYSLFFSMQHIPEDNRKMMLSQLEGQMGELKKQKSASLQTNETKTEHIIGQYVQDLYRFYKLFYRKNEFKDIFQKRLDFHNMPIMQPYISDKNDLSKIAEYYLRKNHFEDALTIYERISGTPENEEMLCQKIGYCKQMTGDFKGATEDYAKAELMNADSKWLLRHTAQCYRAMKKPEMAIKYYLHYEKLDTNNMSVLLSIGSCYLEMKDYSEALKYYFKVDYLDSDSHKAWRPIAWCSFLTGKYDQARNYYKKIISYKPDAQDFMNAGHTEWVLQNINGALELYKKSVQSAENFEQFNTDFSNDIPDLKAAGIDTSEIPLILDILRYSTN